jgi:hypothetical protein
MSNGRGPPGWNIDGMNLLRGIRVEDTGTAIVEGAVREDQRSMPLDHVFWSHFSRNLGPSGWVIGILAATLGLGFWWGLAAIVIGNLLGSVPVAFCALMGPQTGLTQMEDSRFAFGRAGTRLPSFINWVCCVGWDAVNNVPSTIALIALLALVGATLPFWLGLALLAGLQMIGSVYGHDVVQMVQKVLGYVLLVVFGIIGYLAVAHGGSIAAPAQPITLATFVLGISLVASFNLGWAPYSADYTRYLPPSTAPAKIFALSFLGMFSSGLLIEIAGLLTASAIPDTTPGALITSIRTLTGGFALSLRDRHGRARLRDRGGRCRAVRVALLELSRGAGVLDRAVARHRARRLVPAPQERRRYELRAGLERRREHLRRRHGGNDRALLIDERLHGADCETARRHRHRLLRRLLRRRRCLHRAALADA